MKKHHPSSYDEMPMARLLAHFPCSTCGQDPIRMLELIPKGNDFIGPLLVDVIVCREGWALFQQVLDVFGWGAEFEPFAPGGSE
jgi:hypothetical protein